MTSNTIVGAFLVSPACFPCCPDRVLGAVVGPARPPEQDRLDDRPREHVEAVQGRPHKDVVAFRGTIDAGMTRMAVGYSAYQQGWQPSRSVVIENAGPADVRNPDIIVNGKRRVRQGSDGFQLPWRANPAGTPPAACKVYGSDERKR